MGFYGDLINKKKVEIPIIQHDYCTSLDTTVLDRRDYNFRNCQLEFGYTMFEQKRISWADCSAGKSIMDAVLVRSRNGNKTISVYEPKVFTVVE